MDDDVEETADAKSDGSGNERRRRRIKEEGRHRGAMTGVR
jgi:hypothetical protein